MIDSSAGAGPPVQPKARPRRATARLWADLRRLADPSWGAGRVDRLAVILVE